MGYGYLSSVCPTLLKTTDESSQLGTLITFWDHVELKGLQDHAKPPFFPLGLRTTLEEDKPSTLISGS